MMTIPVTQSQLLTKESARITRPEIQLLLCCTRTQIDPTTENRIKGLLQQDIDWTYLIQTSICHSVMPLLYRSLNSTCPEAVSKSILSQLRNFYHTNAQRNLFLTSELVNLLNLFQDNGIPAIPFKGLSLAVSAYGNLVLRQFSDLDILVHKQDINRAKQLLTSHKYQLTKELFWESHFISEGGRVNIDLHQAITPKYFSFPVDFNELWKRLQPVSLVNRTIFTFSSEDSLLILCVYIAKDCWDKRERLIQVCDIAELLRHQKIDWELLIEQATKLGITRIVLLGLLLANQLLGTALPEEILSKIQAEPTVKLLATQVCEWLFHKTDSPNVGFERKLFYLKVRERLEDIIPLLDYWITPSQTDRDFFLLPNSLSFLYYLVRQIRLVGKYGLRIRCWQK
ncbi:nucleotidyltransferase family protein [Okeania sp.]|uniref:nucleotidyltransferase domain-containing protein n=1 Tax=Okeania sp. TaxID=3100323 RepID=UPI002B4AC9E2|nr:nucleotidyltransferase family protein [Okeania sp.]MEB3342867.1 nucleotidyltransferase family protein [Okeania sp.]